MNKISINTILVFAICCILLITTTCKKDDKTQAPGLIITFPEEGAEIIKGDTVLIQVDASASEYAIESVYIGVDEGWRSPDDTPPYTYSWNTGLYTVGEHTIKAASYISTGINKLVEIKVQVVAPDQTFENSLVGTYVLGSALFNEAVTMFNVYTSGDTVTFLQGADATLFANARFFGPNNAGFECNDPHNSAIDFRAEGDLFWVCLGEQYQLRWGTWGADGTNNSFNFGNTILTCPTRNTLTNVLVDEYGISGNINAFPLPIDFSQSISPCGNFNKQFVSVAIVFLRVNL